MIKKPLQFAFSIALLAVLGISQMPQPVSCQMAFGPMFAKTCRMPCCQKTEVPLSNRCPLFKAQAPNDTIAGHSTAWQDTLQSVGIVVTASIVEPQQRHYGIQSFLTIVTALFSRAPSTIRAPPSDVHLLAA